MLTKLEFGFYPCVVNVGMRVVSRTMQFLLFSPQEYVSTLAPSPKQSVSASQVYVREISQQPDATRALCTESPKPCPAHWQQAGTFDSTRC